MSRAPVVAACALLLSCGAADSSFSGDRARSDHEPSDQGPGAEIVFTSTRDGNWELYSMRADGSAVRRLTRNSGSHTPSDGWAKWSPDGSEIAFMSDPRSHGVFSIYVMKALGGDVRRLTPEPAARSDDTEYPSWSPDGTRIAYYSPSSGLHIMSSTGSSERLLVAARTCDCPISWSPDGTTILFATDRGPSPGIHAIAVASGVTSLVRELSGSYIQPEWSPDGSRIAVASDVDNGRTSVIRVMNADGSNLTLVTDNASRGSVTWSPDGQRLAFSSERDGNLDIFVIGTDGSNPTNLTRSRGDDFDPHWVGPSLRPAAE